MNYIMNKDACQGVGNVFLKLLYGGKETGMWSDVLWDRCRDCGHRGGLEMEKRKPSAIGGGREHIQRDKGMGFQGRGIVSSF